MGTEEYSDFDSDSGEELLYDMRDEKEQKEAAIQSNNEGENIKDNGKETLNFNLNCLNTYWGNLEIEPF